MIFFRELIKSATDVGGRGIGRELGLISLRHAYDCHDCDELDEGQTASKRHEGCFFIERSVDFARVFES